jgi:hypothetical protein
MTTVSIGISMITSAATAAPIATVKDQTKKSPAAAFDMFLMFLMFSPRDLKRYSWRSLAADAGGTQNRYRLSAVPESDVNVSSWLVRRRGQGAAAYHT